MAQQILFYIFSFLTILGALNVVISRHPVKAVLSLVFTFVMAAVLWLLLQVEFLALALIVVYVGAVMVLFLFVVMMIDVDITVRDIALPLRLLLSTNNAEPRLLIILIADYYQQFSLPNPACRPDIESAGVVNPLRITIASV